MRRYRDVRRLFRLALVCAGLFGAGLLRAAPVFATPAITMDVATGDVLFQEEATQPWFPASTTKLMTVYVALSAVRDHQIAMNTPLVVSARAHKMPSSKMGFAVGTQVTLDNALKMLMVRSANDIAITVAEGIGGSVEGFADDMNQAAAQLGMHESHFVNPNGLPASDHYSSVRDMAILARALYTQFPDEAGLFNLGELSLGSQRIPNHNNLLGRYPGVDGMKTGFTCAAGFNVVASAFRDGRRLVVVVFGAPSVATRSAKVAALFDRGFAGVDRPIASVLALPASTGGGPPDMHDQVCRARGGLIARFNSEVEELDAPLMSPTSAGIGLSALSPERAFLFAAPTTAAAGTPMALRINSMPPPAFDPVPVRVGADPGYNGVVAEARAPHTPIGTETPPVTAEAYAAAPAGPALRALGTTPLAIDPSALPLRGRRGRLARAPGRGRVGMKAAAEAPKTKIIAGVEGDEDVAKPAARAPVEKPVPATRRGTAHARKPLAGKPRAIGDGDEAVKAKPTTKGAAKGVAKPPTRAAAKQPDVKKPDVKKIVAKKPEPKKAAGAKPKPKVNASN